MGEKKPHIQNKELLRLFFGKTKNIYFANINKTDIVDNKLFWKEMKQSLSDKVMARVIINCLKKDNLLQLK